MKIAFIGTKNFHFFSSDLLSNADKIIITSKKQSLPSTIESDSKIIRVNEVYDANSKTVKLDIEECLQELKNIVLTRSDFKVFCNQEANLEVAESIRKHFNLYDHMNGRVECFRDKLLMKEILREKGLRTPIFFDLSSARTILNYDDLSQKFGGDFVIKPSASVGSRGVYKIFAQEDFTSFIKDTLNDDCHFEAEEFIDGDLYEYDTVIENGKIIYSNVSRYNCPMADLQEGKTLGSIMVGRSEKIHQRISAFGKQCIGALEANNGCFHMEIFHSKNDELVFLEVAARSPGLMTVPAYLLWEGVNMYDLELLIQCGLPAENYVNVSKEHVSRPSYYVIYPKLNGEISSLDMPSLDVEIDIDWQVKRGEIVNDTTTNIDYAARFFVTCNNIDDANKTFSYLTDEFKAIKYTV